MWTRSALAAGLLTALALTGCGDDGEDAATDPGGTTTAESPSESPADTPTVGTYPEFEPDDYEYTLAVACFCPGAGVPVRVTVQDGAVTDAVYARTKVGAEKGEPAPEHLTLTINDIIEEINASTEAESVDVQWPEGQDYPSEVFIDKSSRIIDEEIGYTVSDVDVG